MTQPPTSQFKLSDLLDRVDGDQASAVAIATQWAELREPLLGGLRAALESGNVGSALELAHEIKGMASMIGAVQLAALVSQIDDGARSGALALGAADPSIMVGLQDHWDAVARCLAPLSPLLSAS